MKTRYKIPIIVISIVLTLSFFVISYDNTLDDTPYDVEILFDEEEYSVNYFVVNGHTNNIEIDIPLDMIDANYFRDLCVPDYLASPSIIKFLNDYSIENILLSEVTSLYDVVQGFESDELDVKLNTYANQNRDETIGSEYVVETSDYALTWFGALQILIIFSN